MSFSNGHALLIGVGEFKHHPKLNVSHTVRDVEALQKILQDPHRCGYPAEQVSLLTRDAATKEAIENALIELARVTTAESTVFIYLASHGSFGTDDHWYFKPHDVVLNGKRRVEPDTGISESRFIKLLAEIKAERLIIFMNTCFSGNLVVGELSDSEELYPETRPSREAFNAMLGSGQGRIIVTAAGDAQKSYFNRLDADALTFFGDAVVRGLKGNSVSANGGFISAFELYSYIYMTVTDQMGEFGDGTLQTPEFTVRKAVGPFPIALHRGKLGNLSEFDDSANAPSEGGPQHLIVPDNVVRQALEQLFGPMAHQLNRPLFGDIHTDQSVRAVINQGDFNVGNIEAAIVNEGGEQTFHESITIDMRKGTDRPNDQPASTGSKPAVSVAADIEQLRSLSQTEGLRGVSNLFFETLNDFLDEIELLEPEDQQKHKQILGRLDGLATEISQGNPDNELIDLTAKSLLRAASKRLSDNQALLELVEELVQIAQKI